MERIDTKLPLGIQRDLAIVALSAFIEGLGEGLFIFFLPWLFNGGTRMPCKSERYSV